MRSSEAQRINSNTKTPLVLFEKTNISVIHLMIYFLPELSYLYIIMKNHVLLALWKPSQKWKTFLQSPLVNKSIFSKCLNCQLTLNSFSPLTGATAGEYVTSIIVNSEEKFLVSAEFCTVGTNGAGTFLVSKSLQLMPWKRKNGY